MQSNTPPDFKSSHTTITTKLPELGLNATLMEFLETDIETKSLHIRNLFEQAAKKAIRFEQLEAIDSTQPFVCLLSGPGKFQFVSNNKAIFEILCQYKPMLFDEKAVYELDENIFGMEVSPETIFNYASSQAAANIPGLSDALKQSQWREKPLLHSVSDSPMIVIRGCVGRYDTNPEAIIVTPKDLACDANTIITEQLINFSQQLQRTQKSSLIQFPQLEGRGAVFSVCQVPFHAYNSYSRNDEFCNYLDLLRPQEGMFWKVTMKENNLLRLKGIIELIALDQLPYRQYTQFPTIKSWFANGYFQTALAMRLDDFVLHSLAFQASKEQQKRILRHDGSQATNEEIFSAVKTLQNNRSIYLATKPDSEMKEGKDETTSHSVKPGIKPNSNQTSS